MNRIQFFAPFAGLVVSLALFGFGCAPTPAQPTAVLPTTTATDTHPTPSNTVAAVASTSTKTPSSTPTLTPAKKPVISKQKPNPVPAHRAYTIEITSQFFGPAILAINAGDTAVWVNKDTIAHSITSDNALLFDSGAILPGKSWSHIFKAVGTYGYHSGITTLMTGKVIVR